MKKIILLLYNKKNERTRRDSSAIPEKDTA